MQRLTDGDAGINYIISHPEHIVHPEVKKILMKKNIANRVCTIIPTLFKINMRHLYICI